ASATQSAARLLKWERVDEKKKLVVIPGDQMKAGRLQKGRKHNVKDRPHTIPLSDAALEILERMRAVRMNDYVFPGDACEVRAGQTHKGMLNTTTPLYIVQKVLPETKITVHGFRASFRDWVREVTNFEGDMA